MQLFIYLVIFMVGGTFGILLGCILASGAASERVFELARMNEEGEAPINQEARTGTNG